MWQSPRLAAVVRAASDRLAPVLRSQMRFAMGPLKRLERYRDRRPADRRADTAFMAALWEHFGDQPFERGNLDAGRLSWLLGREVVAVDDPFDPVSYEALLVINEPVARASFPEVFQGDEAQNFDDDADEGW